MRRTGSRRDGEPAEKLLAFSYWLLAFGLLSGLVIIVADNDSIFLTEFLYFKRLFKLMNIKIANG